MTSALKYTNKLAQRHVLVLGGTSGMGFCVAEAALEYGASVVVSGSSSDKLERALSRLRHSYPSLSSKITGYTCDLSDLATQEANLLALLQAATVHAKLDHIAMTAGDALEIVPITNASADYIQRAGTVRFIGAVMLAKLLPAFVVAGSESSLTLTGGVNTTKPAPGWSIMAGWGGALEGLMRGLAVDLKPLRVNLVSPGAVHTELFNSIPADHLQSMLEAWREKTLTGSVAKPEDVAEAYVYTMKDHGVTGTIINTNGGCLLK
ncbi:MAG: hypothetical protein M1818_004040 [Claussenomyces sp. TS43310]|nr:MAG: hypothetical protein M1818_004040 [Claussenomyces sp. TS43310]